MLSSKPDLWLASLIHCWALLLLAALLGGCAPKHNLKLPGFEFSAPRGGADAPFLAGAAKTELTPAPGFPNAGHGPPAAIARGYWSRLYARAIYLRDSSGTPLVLVSCDLYAVSHGL